MCRTCGQIHYQNPRIVAGCLVKSGKDVLLCKRAIEPRQNLWTLPAGFLERGETTQQGAKRETQEEACADVDILQPYAQYDLAYLSQIYVFYLAELRGSFAPGTESLDVALFNVESVPWDNLAFPVVHVTLSNYFNDRECGTFEFRQHEIPNRAHWDRSPLPLPDVLCSASLVQSLRSETV